MPTYLPVGVKVVAERFWVPDWKPAPLVRKLENWFGDNPNVFEKVPGALGRLTPIPPFTEARSGSERSMSFCRIYQGTDGPLG